MNNLLVHFLYFSFLLFAVSNLELSQCTQINILPSTPNTYLNERKKMKYQQYISPLSELPKKGHIVEKLCNRIISTSQFLGNSSMSLYSTCDKSMELLGTDNNLLTQENPFCFNNLASFFCSYYYKSSNKFHCDDSSFVNFILNMIYNSLQADYTKYTKYYCPSLNFQTYKIESPSTFCDEMRQKYLIERNEKKRHFRYITLANGVLDTCEDIVNVYNSCIEADNLLFPNGNYEKCFNANNNLYKCNELGIYNQKEIDTCKQFVLPSVAALSIHDDLMKLNANSFCTDYENKMFNQYTIYLSKLDELIEKSQKNIELYDIMVKKTDQLVGLSKELLDKISVVISKWNIKNAKGENFDRIMKMSEDIKMNSEINIINQEEEEEGQTLPEIINIYQKIKEALDMIENEIEIRLRKNEIDDPNTKNDVNIKFDQIIQNFKDFLKNTMNEIQYIQLDKLKKIGEESDKIYQVKGYKQRINIQKENFIDTIYNN